MKDWIHRHFSVRLTAAVLALAAVLAAVPEPVCAVEFVRQEFDGKYVTEEDAGGFHYIATEKELNAGKCRVYLYVGSKKNIVLPKKCGNYKVTGVEMNFSGALMLPDIGNGVLRLKTVKIPSGYRTIGSGCGGRLGAFQNQTKLYRIEIPKSVTKIGAHAFDGCNFEKLTIVTPKGSAAERYARAHGILCTDTTALTVVPETTQLAVGKKSKIAVYNCGSKITWKSSNPAVAAVNSKGVVTAKKAGKVKITATINKTESAFTFTVK